jgi:hypothetical protein
MSSLVTVRNTEYIDNRFPELRRGFLDARTPVSALKELEMPVSEQREFLKRIVADAEAERAILYEAIGRPNKKNFTHYTNKRPRKRNGIRSRQTQFQRDADRYLDLGRRMAEVHKMLAALPKPPRKSSPDNQGTKPDGP